MKTRSLSGSARQLRSLRCRLQRARVDTVFHVAPAQVHRRTAPPESSDASTCLPRTIRQTVMGVAKINQRAPTATSRIGSPPQLPLVITPCCARRAWAQSPHRQRPLKQRTRQQSTRQATILGQWLQREVIGNTPAIIDPMNGTNRINPARKPQRTGLGRPIAHRQAPMKTPNAEFRSA